MLYLALSYVWGRTTMGHKAEPADEGSHLPDGVPKTVAYAIVVTKRLGQRYLWVDRYCILHSQGKPTQIANMNKIYQGAWCTIIALDGLHADAGLAGISRPRNPQKKVHTTSGCLLSTLPHILYESKASKWATRAWCYQEAVLSPRSLVFTASQVHLACRTSMTPEIGDSVLAVDAYGARNIFSLTLTDPWWARAASERLQPYYASHVSQYSSRDLQFDEDALAAFRGIIASGVIGTVWGVPLQRDLRGYQVAQSSLCIPGISEKDFAFGLTWVCNLQDTNAIGTQRRKGFPTWSWLNLKSQISLGRDDVYDFCQPITSRFQIEISNNEWVALRDMASHFRPGSRIIETKARGLRIHGPWIPVTWSNIGTASGGNFRVPNGDQDRDTCVDNAIIRVTAWIDEPQLINAGDFKNDATMIFLLDVVPDTGRLDFQQHFHRKLVAARGWGTAYMPQTGHSQYELRYDLFLPAC